VEASIGIRDVGDKGETGDDGEDSELRVLFVAMIPDRDEVACHSKQKLVVF
jgi:hypothetical protein